MDYWLLFCLLVPFLIFLIEVVWLLQRRPGDRKGQANWTDVDSDPGKDRRRGVRVAVPAMTAAFVLLYFTAALILTCRQ
jgi:uncharacterized iron-regulated membrane protein